MYEKCIKRILDIVLSALGLILLSWLFLILIVAIKLDDPGPAFFSQKRVGIHKSHFPLHKFRSMKMSTPHDTPTHLLSNPDQYITKIGKFIRKTSLDELPQLWDIFVGKMSVIGPRPALWNQYDLLEERDKYGANDVKPGLTGWAQIHGRDELEIDVKAQLDGYYVEHLSFLMDVKCFFGTIVSVVKHEGVVEGGTGAMQEQRRNKVLIITNHSYMLWQFRRELIAELMRENEVVLSMPFVGHEEDFRAMGLRCIETDVDRRGINPITDLKLYRTYKNLLRTEQPDMVVTYSIKPNIYAGYACRKAGIPYCANVQGLGTAFQKKLISMIVTVMYRAALKNAKTVFFENTANAELFVERGIMPREKQTLLHGAGVNLDLYPAQPYPSEAEGIRFLYLGRIMKEKGMDEFFAAARCVKAEYGDRVKFDLVGFFEDEYKETVEQLERDGIVRFHGFQADPKPYYASAHCIVLPSYHEGMSNVLLEAAATGRALITTDIPGCREAVEDGINGYLCEKRNAQSLEDCMKRFLALSEDDRRDMGQHGRKKMEREFDKNQVVRETVAAILGSAVAV